ncbi:MAG: hypothetical protein ACT4P1_04460 [Sporichthyaceae bacterium]
MPRSLMLAFTSPVSEATEDDYNRWYDTKHLHDVVAIKGVVAATMYRLAHGVETLPGVSGPTQKYLAIYELEAESVEELEAFCGSLRAALASGEADIDPSLDMADLGASLALPVGSRLLSPHVPAEGA